jgi:hypothetical protein
MNKARRTYKLSGYKLEQLEKSGLWNDAIDWPKSWHKVLIKFLITLCLFGGLGSQSYIAIESGHIVLGGVTGFIFVGCLGYWTTMLKAFAILLRLKNQGECLFNLSHSQPKKPGAARTKPTNNEPKARSAHDIQ